MFKGLFDRFGKSRENIILTAEDGSLNSQSAILDYAGKFVDFKEVSFDVDNIPRHIAIIMDGNGRWAKQKNMPRTVGHRQGVETLENVVEACGKLSVDYLTVYAFSTENWLRPKEEVSILMKLLVEFAENKLLSLCKSNVKVRVLGDMQTLPSYPFKALSNLVAKTQENTGLGLNLAINYGSRWEILEAVKRIATEARNQQLTAEQIAAIDEGFFEDYLSTKEQPAPDLLIRTSGEKRLSNFLLWQLAYTEFYFTEVLWPDFKETELIKAISYYQKRSRRFGGLE